MFSLALFALEYLRLRADSFWRRMTATGSRGAQKRFIETFELFWSKDVD